MAFLESRIDERITRGAHSTVTASREKTYTTGGRLRQQFNRSRAIHKLDISHGLRSAAAFQTVLDMFYVVMFAPYVGFRAKDWRDYQATKTNSALVLVSGTTYQLQRKHTAGAINHLRNVVKPVTGKVAVYDSGDVLLGSTPDYTTGTVAVPTGTPSYWLGEFDLPVTFDNDEWVSELEGNSNKLWVASQPIILEEIIL